jgi:hypothetical protein
MACVAQSVSRALPVDESEEDKYHDVVEETQTGDFVSRIIGSPRNAAPIALEFDDTASVVEVPLHCVMFREDIMSSMVLFI